MYSDQTDCLSAALLLLWLKTVHIEYIHTSSNPSVYVHLYYEYVSVPNLIQVMVIVELSDLVMFPIKPCGSMLVRFYEISVFIWKTEVLLQFCDSPRVCLRQLQENSSSLAASLRFPTSCHVVNAKRMARSRLLCMEMYCCHAVRIEIDQSRTHLGWFGFISAESRHVSTRAWSRT